jgi:hypothetical protein
MVLNPIIASLFFELGKWFQQHDLSDQCIFKQMHDWL